MPPIANEFGLKVMVGAWIDKFVERNEREMLAAIDLTKHNSNVNGIVVGNETIYRGEQIARNLRSQSGRLWSDSFVKKPNASETLSRRLKGTRPKP